MENQYPKIFEYRLDYYWKSLSLYAIVLSIFILIRESISNVKVIESIYQPIIFLLILVTVITSAALLYQMYQKKKIIFYDDKIILKNRWFEKTINFSEINKILIKKNKFKKIDTYRLILIRLKNKRRGIRINPGYYNNENQLIDEFIQIKQKLSYEK